MKTHLYRLPLLFFILLICACAKETTYITAPIPVATSSSFSAKVDGNLVECPIANVSIYDLGSKKTMQISGSKGFEAFQMTVDDYKGVGTYDLTTINIGVYLGDSKNAANTSYMSTSGNVKITSVTDKVMTGTFEFKGHNYTTNKDITISAGVFSISLVNPVPPAANPNDKSLTAKANGTPLTFTTEANLLINVPQVGKVMTIIGVNGSKTLALSMLGYKGVGTYTMKDDGQGTYDIDTAPTGQFTSEDVGKIVVTNATATTIEGTFEFDGYNTNGPSKTTTKITEGTFKLSFATKSF